MKCCKWSIKHSAYAWPIVSTQILKIAILIKMLSLGSKMPLFIHQISKNVKDYFQCFQRYGKIDTPYTVNESSLFKGCWTESITFVCLFKTTHYLMVHMVLTFKTWYNSYASGSLSSKSICTCIHKVLFIAKQWDITTVTMNSEIMNSYLWIVKLWRAYHSRLWKNEVELFALLWDLPKCQKQVAEYLLWSKPIYVCLFFLQTNT